MQATAERPGFFIGADTSSRWFGWSRLADVSAIAAAALLFGTAVILGDREAGALGAATIVGLLLTRFRGGLLGHAMLACIFTATVAFMLPGATVDLLRGEGIAAYVLPLSLAAAAIAGLIGSSGSLVTRGQSGAGSQAATLVAGAVLVVFGLALVSGSEAANANAPAAAVAPLEIWAKTNAFSTTNLTSRPGQVTVRFANRDLFWHTFTVPALGVDLKVPVNGEDEVTFQAAPGTYDFYCSIPGHALIGMKGTLTIQ
jgi:plastocyanin